MSIVGRGIQVVVACAIVFASAISAAAPSKARKLSFAEAKAQMRERISTLKGVSTHAKQRAYATLEKMEQVKQAGGKVSYTDNREGGEVGLMRLRVGQVRGRNNLRPPFNVQDGRGSVTIAVYNSGGPAGASLRIADLPKDRKEPGHAYSTQPSPKWSNTQSVTAYRAPRQKTMLPKIALNEGPAELQAIVNPMFDLVRDFRLGTKTPPAKVAAHWKDVSKVLAQKELKVELDPRSDGKHGWNTVYITAPDGQKLEVSRLLGRANQTGGGITLRHSDNRDTRVGALTNWGKEGHEFFNFRDARPSKGSSRTVHTEIDAGNRNGSFTETRYKNTFGPRHAQK